MSTSKFGYLLVLAASLVWLCLPVQASDVSPVAEIKPDEQKDLLLHQFYLSCLSHASYLVADPITKEAAVVDPQRDVDQYIEDAQKLGLKIKYVILTHVHADFLAGHLELQRRTGAQICLGSKSKTDFKFHALNEGDKLSLGTVYLQATETPGHTPEAISLLVYKPEQKDPYAVLTGDALFIGDVGRPDLLASSGWTSEQLAKMLYHTLHEKVMKLPDETRVYPAHGAGSYCGRSLGKETVSTIGEQRKNNYALKPMTEDEFVKQITAELPKTPAYFSYDAKRNCSKHQMLETVMQKSKRSLDLEQVLKYKNSGAQMLDVREPDEFAKGFLIDSINVPLHGRFALYAGMMLKPKKSIVVIAPEGKEKEAITRLGRIGFDNVVGYADKGFATFDGRSDLISQTTRVNYEQLSSLMQSDKAPLVLDVRTAGERRDAAIDKTLCIPLAELPERFAEIPQDREVVILCQTGCRSSVAASLFRKEGYKSVRDMSGGMAEWTKNKMPTIAGCSDASCTVKQ